MPTEVLTSPGLFGDFSPGRACTRRSDPLRLAAPIPFRGMQGFFKAPDALFEPSVEQAV